MVSYIPKRCIIEIDYKCNLKCQSCYLWNENYRKIRGENKDVLSYEEIKQLQNKLFLSGVKRITYIGGEPFLSKNIINIAINAKENKLIPSIVTNGTLLTEEMIFNIVEKEIFNTIIISLDGNKNIHNFIRGKSGVYEMVYDVLRLFQKIKNKKKAKLPKVYIYSTISNLNIKYIEKIYKIAESVNANKLRFQLASSINQEIIEKTNSILGFNAINIHSYMNNLILSENDIEYARKLISKILNNKSSGMKIETENIFSWQLNNKCQFIYKDFIITPSGNILICPMLTNFSIGNIKNNNIIEIFESSKDQIDNLLNIANNGKLPVCSQCCVEKIKIKAN